MPRDGLPHDDGPVRAAMIVSGEPTLRPATIADVDEMASTVIAGFETYRAFAPDGWEPPLLRAEIGYLEQHLALHGTWAMVAEAPDGSMAGHVLLRRSSPAIPGGGRIGHFGMLFLREPWWGSGLAVTLMQHALLAAPALGYEALRLNTPAAHDRARRFYEREGWNLAGPPAFDQAFGMDMVVYKREVP